MTKEYRIYRFRRPQDNEVITEFFLPDQSVIDSLVRERKIAQYRKNGYMCAGFIAVDKETYLNARLDESVKEYLENDRYGNSIQSKFSSGLISSEVYFETMRLVDDFKWTCLKKIDMQVRRLLREDFGIHNEVALQVFNYLHSNCELEVM